MSTALAAAVRVGAEPPGHLTVAGQVAVRPPVASCTSRNSRLATPPVGAVKVKVQLPVIVTSCLLPLFQSTVLAVPELPLLYSEAKTAVLLISILRFFDPPLPSDSPYTVSTELPSIWAA